MFDYFDIEDFMIIGPLSEELADMDQEKRQIERDYEDKDDSYHDDDE